MIKRNLLLSLILLLFPFLTFSQTYEPNWESLNTRGIPEWFHQDKFGIFIHWGVYSVPSYAPVIHNSGYSYAEWYWNRLESKDEKEDTLTKQFHYTHFGKDFPYQDLEKEFHAELFDPDQWAHIFKESGARYVVLTSKHHEGYCLWESPWADQSWGRPWNAVTGTPKRDLLGDLTASVRKAGLKMGFYYSLYEWFNPLWKEDKQAYIKEVMFPEFKDLVTKYKPSVIFSDGEWDLPDTVWHSPELLAWLFNESPVKEEVVVNDRWGSNTRNKNHGSTYATSEYGSGMDPDIVWEESRGIGQSYGYNRMETLTDYETGRKLILSLVDIVSRGGNLLLDVGPTADGRIPVIMQQRLSEIGDWLKVNGEAIYGSEPWQKTRQWSEGDRPEVSQESYMTGYNIEDLVDSDADHAFIQAFFTKKGGNLYCIIPTYTPHLAIRGISLSAASSVEILGHKGPVSYEEKEGELKVDLSQMHPGEVQVPFVIKIGEVIQ